MLREAGVGQHGPYGRAPDQARLAVAEGPAASRCSGRDPEAAQRPVQLGLLSPRPVHAAGRALADLQHRQGNVIPEAVQAILFAQSERSTVLHARNPAGQVVQPRHLGAAVALGSRQLEQPEADLEGDRSSRSAGAGGCGFVATLEGRVPGVLHRLPHEQRRFVLEGIGPEQAGRLHPLAPEHLREVSACGNSPGRHLLPVPIKRRALGHGRQSSRPVRRPHTPGSGHGLAQATRQERRPHCTAAGRLMIDLAEGGLRSIALSRGLRGT